MLAIKTTTGAEEEEWRKEEKEEEVEIKTEEIKTPAGSTTTEATTRIAVDVFEFEKEEEEGESEEWSSEYLNATIAPSSEIQKEKEDVQIEKTGIVCKTLIGVERMAMELLLLFSLILNFYLMLVYPVLIFTGRKWLKKQIRENRERETSVQRERQMLPGMMLDIEIEDRQKEEKKETKAKCSWFRLMRFAKLKRGE